MAANAIAAAKAAGLDSNVVYVPHPSASPAQIALAQQTGAATPLYEGNPAPMGLADYGWAKNNPEVYVTNQGSNTVSIISDSDHEVLATVPVGSSPNGVAYDPANGDVYVANSGSDNVTVLHGTTRVATIPVGTEP